MNLSVLAHLATALANSAAPPDDDPAFTILILFVAVAVVVAIGASVLAWLRRR
jgi:hypothetical protein